MDMSGANSLRIIEKFLQSDYRYLELGLAVEEAVESLRRDEAAKVYAAIRKNIEEVHNRRSTKKWQLTDTVKYIKSGHPLFWQRLYKEESGWDKKDQYAGVWIGRWKSERLSLEVCAEAWPARESKTTDLNIKDAFAEFKKKAEHPLLWQEDERNERRRDRVSYHFHGDKAFLTGDIQRGVEDIATLAAQFVKVLDQE